MTGGKPKVDNVELHMEVASPELQDALMLETFSGLMALFEHVAARHQLGTMPVIAVATTLLFQSWEGVDDKLGLEYLETQLKFMRARTDGEKDHHADKAQRIYEKLGKVALRKQMQAEAGQGGGGVS